MGKHKGYRHIRRPKTQRAWCGFVWIEDNVKPAASYEVCPMCDRRSKR